MTNTDLVYNIVERRLRGVIDGLSVNAPAGSGGRAGSKRYAEDPFLANNPYATRVKETSLARPGGPLIMATYLLRTHESRAHWIRLEPLAGENLHGRAGFAIHGRGPQGSQGCIVPTDFAVVLLIYHAVKQREIRGENAPTLAVVAIGDLDSVDRRLDRLRQTA